MAGCLTQLHTTFAPQHPAPPCPCASGGPSHPQHAKLHGQGGPGPGQFLPAVGCDCVTVHPVAPQQPLPGIQAQRGEYECSIRARPDPVLGSCVVCGTRAHCTAQATCMNLSGTPPPRRPSPVLHLPPTHPLTRPPHTLRSRKTHGTPMRQARAATRSHNTTT